MQWLYQSMDNTVVTFSALRKFRQGGPKSSQDVSMVDCISALLSMLYALLMSLSNKIYGTCKKRVAEGGMTPSLSSWELEPNLNRTTNSRGLWYQQPTSTTAMENFFLCRISTTSALPAPCITIKKNKYTVHPLTCAVSETVFIRRKSTPAQSTMTFCPFVE